MHSCPSCGLACYCHGDIDDIDVGDVAAEANCSHCVCEHGVEIDECDACRPNEEEADFREEERASPPSPASGD